MANSVTPVPTMAPSPTPTSTPSVPPTPPFGWVYQTPTPQTYYAPGATATPYPSPVPTIAPLTPEQKSQLGDVMGILKNGVDGILEGLNEAGKIKIGPGGTLIGYGVDGAIQFFQDSSGNYSLGERFMRAGARTFESGVIGIPSSVVGTASGAVVTGLAGPEASPIGFAIGYFATSSVISNSIEPYMQNNVFPLLSR